MTPEQELEKIQKFLNPTFKTIEFLQAIEKEIDNKIAELKAKIEAAKTPPVTYSIGDRFELGNEEVLLVEIPGHQGNLAALVRKGSGGPWNCSFVVRDKRAITEDEIKGEIGGLTRTYDSRKQKYVGEKITRFEADGIKFRLDENGCFEIKNESGWYTIIRKNYFPELLSQITKILR